MKLEVNIEKKYAYGILGTLILLAGILIVYAEIDTSQPYHDASQIRGLDTDSLMESYYNKEQIRNMLSTIGWYSGCPDGYTYYDNKVPDEDECWKDGEIIKVLNENNYNRNLCEAKIENGMLYAKASCTTSAPHLSLGYSIYETSGWLDESQKINDVYVQSPLCGDGTRTRCSFNWTTLHAWAHGDYNIAFGDEYFTRTYYNPTA